MGAVRQALNKQTGGQDNCESRAMSHFFLFVLCQKSIDDGADCVPGGVCFEKGQETCAAALAAVAAAAADFTLGRSDVLHSGAVVRCGAGDLMAR